MDLKSEDLNHFSPAAAPAAEFNKCVEAENTDVVQELKLRSL